MEPEDEGDICLVESETESAAKVVSTMLEAEPIDAASVLVLRPVLGLRDTLEADGGELISGADDTRVFSGLDEGIPSETDDACGVLGPPEELLAIPCEAEFVFRPEEETFWVSDEVGKLSGLEKDESLVPDEAGELLSSEFEGIACVVDCKLYRLAEVTAVAEKCESVPLARVIATVEACNLDPFSEVVKTNEERELDSPPEVVASIEGKLDPLSWVFTSLE